MFKNILKELPIQKNLLIWLFKKDTKIASSIGLYIKVTVRIVLDLSKTIFDVNVMNKCVTSTRDWHFKQK